VIFNYWVSVKKLLKSQTRRVRTTNGRLKELGDPVQPLIRVTIRTKESEEVVIEGTIISDDLMNCGAPYGNFQKLTKHYNICPGLTVVCSYCGKDNEHPSKFSNPASLGMHMKKYHEKEYEEQRQQPVLRSVLRPNRRV
jgi:hypothetical protein